MNLFPPVARDLKPRARWSETERTIVFGCGPDWFLTMTPAEAERAISQLQAALESYTEYVEAAA